MISHFVFHLFAKCHKSTPGLPPLLLCDVIIERPLIFFCRLMASQQEHEMFPAYIEKVMQERLQKRLDAKMQKKMQEQQVSSTEGIWLWDTSGN